MFQTQWHLCPSGRPRYLNPQIPHSAGAGKARERFPPASRLPGFPARQRFSPKPQRKDAAGEEHVLTPFPLLCPPSRPLPSRSGGPSVFGKLPMRAGGIGRRCLAKGKTQVRTACCRSRARFRAARQRGVRGERGAPGSCQFSLAHLSGRGRGSCSFRAVSGSLRACSPAPPSPILQLPARFAFQGAQAHPESAGTQSKSGHQSPLPGDAQAAPA